MWWWFYFDLLGVLYIYIFFFLGGGGGGGGLFWIFFNICLTFTHSFTQFFFFFVLWGRVSVGRFAFSVFGHKHPGY